MTHPSLYFSTFRGKRLHLGVCGSVAAFAAVDILRSALNLGMEVSACLTESAERFVTPLTFAALGASPVYENMFAVDDGRRFAHLEPGCKADAFLIAPASATTLARLACGMANNLLSAQALAFPGPLVLAPAMNPRMWEHPATQANVDTLISRGVHLVEPLMGRVACGESGQGKLASCYDILSALMGALSPKDYLGQTVLVTLGPTQEHFDSVRFWTNASTGFMGSCLVHALHFRGAQVHAVAGPGVPGLPLGVFRHDVTNARQMYEAAADLWPVMDKGVFTAAVADFAPQVHVGGKFKKEGRQQGFNLAFNSNPDILATLAASASDNQRLLAFAAETNDLEQSVRDKLRRKGAHLMAGNYVGRENSGFGDSKNTVFVRDCHGREEQWPALSKCDVAWGLLDWLSTL